MLYELFTNYYEVIFPIQYADKYNLQSSSFANKYLATSPTFTSKYDRGTTQYVRTNPPNVAEKVIDNVHFDNYPPSQTLSASGENWELSTNYYAVLYPMIYEDQYTRQENPYMRTNLPRTSSRVRTI